MKFEATLKEANPTRGTDTKPIAYSLTVEFKGSRQECEEILEKVRKM